MWSTWVAQGVPASGFFMSAQEVGTLLRADLAGMVRDQPDATGDSRGDAGRRGGASTLFPGPLADGGRGDPADLVAKTRRPARVDDWERVPGAISAFIRMLGISSSCGQPDPRAGAPGALAVHSKQTEPLPTDTEARMGRSRSSWPPRSLNIEARSELAASRARIVAAADEERRRRRFAICMTARSSASSTRHHV